MKKFISLFLCVALLVVAAPAAFASYSQEVENKSENATKLPVDELADLNVNESLVLDDGAVITRISTEEHLNTISECNGISLAEAESLVNENEMALVNANGGGYSYFNYSRTFNYSTNPACPFKATLEALIDLYIVNSYAEITNVSSIGTRMASGIYVGTWVQTGTPDYKILYPSSQTFPAGKVEIRGRGYFQVSANAAASAGYDMKGFGFSLSAAPDVGWLSQTLNMSGTYQTY